MCFYECVLFSYKAEKENNFTINYKNGRLLLKVSGKMGSLSLSYIEGSHDVQLEIDIMFPCFH